MLSNPARPDPNKDEGTVLQVDAVRCLCKVRTLKGQVLSPVSWTTSFGGSTRGSDRSTPHVGDRVFLDFGLGYPVITGFLPKLQLADGATPLSINSGDELVDTGSYSPNGSSTKGDQNRPLDTLLGDRLFSSIGGAFLGLLRGGSVVLRSSRVSEIFLSKFDSLVRVVSRNWEHYTDVSSEIIRNYKGRVYQYSGYASTYLKSKIEDYNLHFYYGDVKAAEAVKTNIHSGLTPPAQDSIIYKEQITDAPPGSATRELMHRTLNLSGNEEVWIFNGSHFTRVISTAEELRLTWNDQNILSITETSIHAFHKDGSDLILDSAGVRASFKDGLVKIEDGKTSVKYGASSIELTTSGITGTSGSGAYQVTPTQTTISNSGHQVTVGPGGVNIS
jgi:hypothetical protein